jgi:hypothetical protein
VVAPLTLLACLETAERLTARPPSTS